MTTPRATGSTAAVYPVLLIGLLSGVLYLVVYLAQRALYRNGLLLSIAGVTVQGDTASRTWLLVQCAAYYGATLILFTLYARLLMLCRRGRLRDCRARALALVFPVLFNLGLLLGRPYLSNDVFSYIAFGYLGASPGGDPYAQAGTSLERTPFGAGLIASGWQPIENLNPYGPLWVQWQTAVLRLTRDVPTATLLLKGLVVAASLGSAALIWVILGRVRPAVQLLGTLIYLWNPVIVVEFAAEGHNDAVMILCVLAALLLTLGARPALAVATLLLGVLAKYVPAILLPAQLAFFWFTWRTRQDRTRLVSLLLLGLFVGIALAVLLYGPFWDGAATLRGLRGETEVPITSSTAGILYRTLVHSPLHMWARPLASGLLDGIFGVYVLLTSWRVRDTEGLLKACAGIALIYLLVASPAYWPWYIALPLALLALSPRSTFLLMVLLLSLAARLVAPLEIIFVRGFIGQVAAVVGTAAIATAMPLLAALLVTIWKWHRQSWPRPE